MQKTADSVTTMNKDRRVLNVIMIEGTANFIVLIVKLVVGLSTGSFAVLADAIHSLTDLANNVVAWVVIRLSAKPADREHPYGHRKFETLAVFGLAAFLTFLAFELALNAIQREEAEIVSGYLELGMMLVVLTINISLATWQRMWAHRLNSDILLADASHTFADVLTTIVVILGWQLSAMGYLWLDTACAIGVAGLVLYLAFGLFKRTLPALVDEYAIEPELLIDTVMNIDGVLAVPRVRSRWIGSNSAVDMVIMVDPTLSTEDSHAITDEIEAVLEQKHHVADISIHVEPYG
jgi:cation diffusion facilitator family transporter